MSETQTQTQNTTQNQSTTKVENIAIRFETRPEVHHVFASNGYAYTSAIVHVKSYIIINNREFEFDGAFVSRDFYIENTEQDVEAFIKKVAESKKTMIDNINKFLKLREKLLTELKQYGEVEEYF